MKRAVSSAINSLDKRAGFSLVHHTTTSYRRHLECAENLNQLLEQIPSGRQASPIDISPLTIDGAALLYPSMVACIRARTLVFHTECDMGYTHILGLSRHDSPPGSFRFQIRPGKEIKAEMNRGTNVFYDARLLTHRQSLDVEEEEFWNIGCYANRRCDVNVFAVLRTAFDEVIQNLSHLNL